MGTTEDKLEILELMARYAQASDNLELDAFVGLFTDDCVMKTVYPGREIMHNGLEELISMQTGFINRFARLREEKGLQVRHFNDCIVFQELTPDRAVTRSYFYFTRTGAGIAPFIAGTGTYEDEIVRTAEGWRFKARKSIFDSLPVPLPE